jgi:hypothetical protein
MRRLNNNHMKKISLFILTTILVILLMSFKEYFAGRPWDDRKNIMVVFNHTLTFNDLVKMKLDLSEKGITLSYRRLVFDENYRLQGITYNVRLDGYGGGDEVDNLSDESRVGFYRDYSKNAKYPFACGNLDQLQIKK